MAQIVVDGMHELASINHDFVTQGKLYAGSALTVVELGGVALLGVLIASPVQLKQVVRVD